VPIQRRGELRPVFIVHGRTGHVMNFQPLALRMAPDRPVYGIQAHGLDGRSEPDRTIEAMARRYVSALREAQAAGPYILGGFSGGGVVAFEMAHQLTAEGESVEPLVLLDTIRPGLQQELRWDYMRYRAKEISRDPVQAREWVKAKARVVRDRLAAGESPIKRRAPFGQPDEHLANAGTGSPTGSATGDSDKVLELTDIYLQAQDRYTMRRWDGRAVLFRASRSLAEDMGSFQAPPDLLWSPFVEQLDIFQIPGGHTDMMLPPNVDVLAERLRMVLGTTAS
jgi:thioesterase domain-containing protein